MGKGMQRKIGDDIESVGWSWIWVFDPEGEHPPFAYSIGFLGGFDHPEIVVAGLPEGVSGAVLNAVSVLLGEGESFGPGDRSQEVLEGLAVEFREIPREVLLSNLHQAAVLYGDDALRGLQLVWPDRDGNFPGEAGASAGLADQQALHE